MDVYIVSLSERWSGELCPVDENEYEAITKPISKVVFTSMTYLNYQNVYCFHWFVDCFHWAADRM